MQTALPPPNSTADEFQRFSGSGGPGGSGCGLSDTSEPGFKYDDKSDWPGGSGCGLIETVLPGLAKVEPRARPAINDAADLETSDRPPVSRGPPGSSCSN